MAPRKMQSKDRLSDLPDLLLLHILSFSCNMKEVVRTSILSKRWQFLWKSVSLSLNFSTDDCRGDQDVVDFVASTNRELHYSKSFMNVQKFCMKFRYEQRYSQDVDSWVYFAIQAANVEDFSLLLDYGIVSKYEFPQFAFKNSSLMNLVLRDCTLKPCGNVNWSCLIYLSIGLLKLNDEVMRKILSGCPKLECLEIASFSGLHFLEITSKKLRKLIIRDCRKERSDINVGSASLKIVAPYIQVLQLLGHQARLQLSNVASLVTAILNFELVYDLDDLEDGEDDLVKECRYAKELLENLAHVKNLELGSWFIEFVSKLELKGWQSPASSRKILTINAALVQSDFPAICTLLQSSPDLETLIIDWTYQINRNFLSSFIKEDEFGKRFEKHIFNCSLLHLKTIKIINFNGPLNLNKFILPLVKYLLKNAEVLEKLIIPAGLHYNRFEGSVVSSDFVEMAQEFLSYPRSSPHAAVIFSYI